MIVYIWISILFVISFLYLCVCVDANSGGILAQIKIFFVDTAPSSIKQGARRICGDWFVEKINDIATYICWKRNPIVQILYLICAVGGFGIYVIKGFIHVPNKYVADYHKYIGTLIMLLCYYSYYKACTVDPGYISRSKSLAACERFTFDNIVF